MAAMGAAHAAGDLLARWIGRYGLVKLAVTDGNQGAQPFPRRLGDQRAETRGLPGDLVGRGRIDGGGFGWFHGRRLSVYIQLYAIYPIRRATFKVAAKK